MSRVPFAVLGVLLAAVVIAVYALHIQWLGFPDGHLTELDRAERAAFPFLASIGGVLALASFIMSIWRFRSARVFRVLLGLALVVVLVFVGLDIGFRSFLEHGGGG